MYCKKIRATSEWFDWLSTLNIHEARSRYIWLTIVDMQTDISWTWYAYMCVDICYMRKKLQE